MLDSNSNLKILLEGDLSSVLALAKGAAAAILDIYNHPDTIDSHLKADASPLTNADMASHRFLVNGLTQLTPGIPVLSEESDAIDFSVRSQWEYYWLIDPLDGTKEFLARNGEFTINIALIHRNHAVIGIIAVPVLNEYYYAVAGKGAFCQTAAGVSSLRTVPRNLEAPLRIAVSRRHHPEKFEALLAKGFEGPMEKILVGSALKFCYIASGKADVYPRLGTTCEWDTAAGQCLVEAAGGVVRTFDNRPLRYNTKSEYENPSFIVYGDPHLEWQPWTSSL